MIWVRCRRGIVTIIVDLSSTVIYAIVVVIVVTGVVVYSVSWIRKGTCYVVISVAIILALPSTIRSAMVVIIVVTGVITSDIYMIRNGTRYIFSSVTTLIIDMHVIIAVVMWLISNNMMETSRIDWVWCRWWHY